MRPFRHTAEGQVPGLGKLRDDWLPRRSSMKKENIS